MKKKETLHEKHIPSLSRVFTPVVMDSLSQTGTSGYLKEVMNNSGLINQLNSSMPLKDFFDWVYAFLFKNYRNEYIYKNVIANKILLGKHSLNTSHMLTEFRAGKCKADVVVLNGTSTVYEIKSEFDSFVRLENQIQSYLAIFDYINVITSASQANKLKLILPEKAGILVLTDRNTITTIRDATANKKNINPNILFDSLRKIEYLKIIREYFGFVPDVPNTRIYKECRALFCKIPPETAHDLTIKVLQNRCKYNALKQFMDAAPSSLSAYAMSICNEKKKLQALAAIFSKRIDSVLFPEFI